MDDLEVYLDHLGYSFPINKKDDINMGVKGNCWGDARLGKILVGDEVSMCDPKVDTKGTVTFIYVDPSIETGYNTCYHVMWNNGMVGQYNRDQLLRTGNKGSLDIHPHNYYSCLRSNSKFTEAIFNNEIPKDHRPHPKFVQINNKRVFIYTTVVWKDGTHTIVKKAADDKFKIDDAIIYAVIKKLCGDNGSEMRRYFDEFFINFKDYKIKFSNEDEFLKPDTLDRK